MSEVRAASVAGQQVNQMSGSQILTILEYSETSPISDLVADIAKGRQFRFTTEYLN